MIFLSNIKSLELMFKPEIHELFRDQIVKKVTKLNGVYNAKYFCGYQKDELRQLIIAILESKSISIDLAVDALEPSKKGAAYSKLKRQLIDQIKKLWDIEIDYTISSFADVMVVYDYLREHRTKLPNDQL